MLAVKNNFVRKLVFGQKFDFLLSVQVIENMKLIFLLLQGSSDSFLKQLAPDKLAAAAAKVGHPLTLRMQPLYDHSYFFISTFMRDHIDHHARALNCRPKL